MDGKPVIYALYGALGFFALTGVVSLVLWRMASGPNAKPDAWHSKQHNEHCDCMECGRKAAERYVKKYESVIKRERNGR